MSFQPRIFTFYSYKGGVGRSMALLNMAYYLHARGRHVLIVDLDLEAPGASGFLHRSKELLPRTAENKGDVVDVLATVVSAVRQAPEGTLPDLRLGDYLRTVDPKKYATAVNPRAPRARLDVLGAEQGLDYTERYSALELSGLSADQVGDASDLLRGLLIQHSFPFHQPWQEEGRAPEPTHYDYILVDSRTGLSEIGGLCIGPLSDRLIVLCGLNDQNIEGTRHFLDVVGLKPKARAANAEAFDDADPPAEDGQRPVTLGPKPTLLVASPVPGGEMTYKKQRMKELEKQLGMAPVKLSYHPQMALMETLFVRDYEDEYLALEYATLAERLMGMVGDTVPQLMAPIHRLLASRSITEETRLPNTTARTAQQMVDPMLRLLANRLSIKEAKPDAVDLLKRLARSALVRKQVGFGLPSFMITSLDLPDESQAQIWRLQINLAPTDELAAEEWLEWADAIDTEDARKAAHPAVFQSIEDKYLKAVTLNPQFYQAFHNWGSTLRLWADTKTGAEADALFALACEKYQQALDIKPKSHDTLHNWGIVLSKWGNTKTGAEADALFALACEKYQQALGIEPKKHDTLHNWGAALSQRANIKEGAEAFALLVQACEKFQQAAALQPNDPDTLTAWGIALSHRTNLEKGAEADNLFAQACEKFQQAAALQPNDPDVLNAWGLALSHRSNLEEGAKADNLFAQACEKFQQSVALQPNDPDILLSWGSALSRWANTKHGAEADSLLVQACERCKQAEALRPNAPDILAAWGFALSWRADSKEGAEANDLFALACEKYQQAAAFESDLEMLFNWGNALLGWAKKKAGADADFLFSQAGEKLQQAAAIEPDNPNLLYVLGCVAALRGRPEEAVAALEKWKSANPEANKSELNGDSDFDRIRNDPRFQAFRDGLAD